MNFTRERGSIVLSQVLLLPVFSASDGLKLGFLPRNFWNSSDSTRIADNTGVYQFLWVPMIFFL